MSDRKIYIGPSLSGSRLKHAQIFIGPLPPDIASIVKEHAWFRTLFVNVGDYRKKAEELQKKETPLALFYKKAKEV